MLFLIFPLISAIAFTVLIDGDEMLNICLEIIVLLFSCPLSLGRDPFSLSIMSAVRGDQLC